MMRGRDAVAVALRHPDGRIVWATERLESGFRGKPAAKWPFVRGLVVLYETLVMGTRWLVRSAGLQAEDEGVEIGKGGVALMLGITAVLGIGLFFILPLVIATFTAGNIENDFVQHFVEGLVRVADLHRLSRADQPHAGHPPRVHVPRRRAHDDPRARGRQAAPPRGDPPHPTAHPRCGTEFLVVVILHLDHRLQPRRPADAAGDDREPDPADPGDRGGRLRGPAHRRPASRQPDRQGADVPRHPRPDDHDQAADRRHDRGRDRGHGGDDRAPMARRSRRAASTSSGTRCPSPARPRPRCGR